MTRTRWLPALAVVLALTAGLSAEGPPAELPAVPVPVEPPAEEGPIVPPADMPSPPPEPAKLNFKPRVRHQFNWVLSDGPGAFDVIEWVSKPDLLSLGDLASWPAERQYDIDGGLNFNIRWWAGPRGGLTPPPDVPPQVFDLHLHLSWRQRWADGVSTEIIVLPGLYTDFRTTPPDGFRCPGWAVGVFRLCEHLHLVGGVQHLQRNRVKVLPVAGLLWEPNERLQCRFVFPEPKVSYHLDPSCDAWVYARGEYGGGTWAYKDNLGRADRVEYSDLRAAVGFEWGSLRRVIGSQTPLGAAFVEVGYVFDRALNFAGPVPRAALPSGWMLSLGGTW